MNTARLLVPIFTLQDFLYLLLDFLLAGFQKTIYSTLNKLHAAMIPYDPSSLQSSQVP
jgi:hypothetical protein